MWPSVATVAVAVRELRFCRTGAGSIRSIVFILNFGLFAFASFNFFVSADGTLLYILASDRSSILVYDLTTQSVSGIELAGNVVPITGDFSVDGGTILVAGSDGLVHQISTSLGGSDRAQIGFPNLPNNLNPFCTITPALGACTLDYLAAKP